MSLKTILDKNTQHLRRMFHLEQARGSFRLNLLAHKKHTSEVHLITTTSTKVTIVLTFQAIPREKITSLPRSKLF